MPLTSWPASAAGDLLPNDYILDQANEAHQMAQALVGILLSLAPSPALTTVTTTGMSHPWLLAHKEIQKLIALRNTNWITDEDIAKAIASATTTG